MNWWRRLFGRRNLEEQLEKELRFHLEQHARELEQRGVDAVEARRQARLELGGPEQVKEKCRDERGTRWLEDLAQDAWYALRMFRKNAGFTVVALATLALGTGATTVMFTLFSGVLLRPLPYPRPDELMNIHGRTAGWDTNFGPQKLSYPDFLDCQRESKTMEMAAVVFNSATMSEPGQPVYVDDFEVSANLFSVLQAPVRMGRGFLPDEDHAGAMPVAILGYSFWRSRFMGNSDALGSSIVLEQTRYTVVGIAPKGLKEYDQEPDVYTLVGQDPAGYLKNRAAQPVHGIGRLRPGATMEQAREEAGLLGQHLAAEYADTNKGRSLLVDPLRPDVGDVQATLWLLLGAVTLVLLIACVNVASLLLARAVSRERELAIRAALGASRGRLARQCLTESAMLGIAGGALGVAIANLGVNPVVALWPGSLPRADEVRLDWRVLGFVLGVSLLSGLLFGLAPALRAPARDLEKVLRGGARSILGGSRKLQSAFVVAEVALAVVLLVAAGMLGQTLMRLSGLDPGVNIRNVLVTRMALSPAVLADPGRILPAWEDVLERARQVPGVEAVAMADTVPMREGYNFSGFWPTADVPPKNRQMMAITTSVSPDYLKVMGMKLLAGRFITGQDQGNTQPVIVIDDVMAQMAFGENNAVGRQLWMPDMPCVAAKPDGTVQTFLDCTAPYTVVGVVGHVRHWGLANDDQAELRAQCYYPFAQVPKPFLRRWSELSSIAVRTSVPPLSVVNALRDALKGASNDQVLYQVRTMDQLADNSLALQRFLMLLFGLFAGLALVLACIGIYGVLAYLTGQRVPEIGVRMALGASPGDVMRQVLRQSMGMISIGVAAGVLGAMGAGRMLVHAVSGMTGMEPVTIAIMVSVLIAAALAASFVPARRASRIDPVRALRQD
jgi:predicted permease